jgi:hypothetical protein
VSGGHTLLKETEKASTTAFGEKKGTTLFEKAVSSPLLK